MRIDRLLRATSFRLAILQTSLFLVMFGLAGASVLVALRRAEARAAHAEIEQMEDDLSRFLLVHGLPAFIAKWPDLTRGQAMAIRLEDASGRLVTGHLPHLPLPRPTPRKLWLSFALKNAARPGEPMDRFMASNHVEPEGMRLTVAEDLMIRQHQDNELLFPVAAIAILTAVLGAGAGVLVGYRMLRRLDRMAQVVDDYASGERSARVAVSDFARGDLDNLAKALNQMMERENRLVEGLRQVSSSLAHDLRRPLARHNQEIAQALAGPATVEGYRTALASASAQVDDVLQTFQALLHIAELEAGAPGLELEPVDLAALGARVVEAYLPMAEAGGRTLAFAAAGEAPMVVMGEPRVLGRMAANLVENALTHTAPGVHVVVRVGPGARLSVSDNGSGVPDTARSRLFERFFRLDASRSTPGSGLGLALAAAAAKAFGGELSAHDAAPGLRITADFTRAARRTEGG